MLQYRRRAARRQRVQLDTPQCRVAPASVPRNARALPAASLRGKSWTTRCHVERARGLVAKVALAEADLQQRVAGLGRARRALEHLLELDHRLAVVALHVVRLADPVQRVGDQRMTRVLGDEVEEVEHGLAVLARAEGRECRAVRLLGALHSPRRLARPLGRRRRRPPRSDGRGRRGRRDLGRRRHRSGRRSRRRRLGARVSRLGLDGVQPGAQAGRLARAPGERRGQLGGPRLQRAVLGARARQLGGRRLLGLPQLGELHAKIGDVGLEAVEGGTARAPRADERKGH